MQILIGDVLLAEEFAIVVFAELSMDGHQLVNCGTR